MDLTKRENEILSLMAKQGLSNKEIANIMWLSVKTVSNYLASIYKKLGVNSARECIAYYYNQIQSKKELLNDTSIVIVDSKGAIKGRISLEEIIE